MKLKKNIFVFAVASLFIQGCSDRMDYNELTEYNKEQVFSSFDMARQFVTNIYSMVENGLQGYDNGATLASACDEAVCAWEGSNVNYFFNGAWSSLKPLTSTWSDSYWAIRACNFYLENCNDYTFEDYKYNKDYLDQMERYNRYQYEVRFLRAYFYFNLVRTYGDVPLIKETLTDKEANSVSRTSSEDVFSFIVDECDKIMNKLPDDYNQVTYVETGRITSLTVAALKARALMYAASPLFYKGDNVKEAWHNAAKANKDVIQMSAKLGVIFGAYTDLWGESNFTASEVIYARRLGNLNSFEYNNYPMGVEGGKSGNCPSQTLVDAYRMKSNGKLWNEEGSGYNETKPYEGRDPRLEATVAYNGMIGWPAYNTNELQTYEGGLNGLPLVGATPTGYYLKKYCDKTVDLRPSKVNQKFHSWVIYRLGEFYLNYAECVYNYFEDPDQKNSELPLSAVDAVNYIRNRANMPELSTGLGESFVDVYRDERMVELAFEGHRFWDVRRWMIGDTQKTVDVMKISKTATGFTYTRETIQRSWDDKMYFFPLPDAEIRRNSNLVQNEGWTIGK